MGPHIPLIFVDSDFMEPGTVNQHKHRKKLPCPKMGYTPIQYIYLYIYINI